MSSIWVTTLWMYGLAIVVSMGVAVIIKLIVVALGALEKKPAVAPAAATPQPAVAAVEGVPAGHVAAIAAAIYAVIGQHRILHIHDAHRHDGWTAEGRLAHHHSHTLDHHPRR
jgi:lysylphosphatidylglycerol synthetase-like protein (DUF2156 family)